MASSRRTKYGNGELRAAVLRLLHDEPHYRYSVSAIARSVDSTADAVQSCMVGLLATRAVKQTEIAVGRQEAYAYSAPDVPDDAACLIVRMVPVMGFAPTP